MEPYLRHPYTNEVQERVMPRPGMAGHISSPYAKKTVYGWPHTFFIFSKIFWAFLGAPGALALYFRIPLVPLHVPIFFPTFQKKSHPEEIPRKKSKGQDLVWLAPYYYDINNHAVYCSNGKVFHWLTPDTYCSSISVPSPADFLLPSGFLRIPFTETW